MQIVTWMLIDECSYVAHLYMTLHIDILSRVHKCSIQIHISKRHVCIENLYQIAQLFLVYTLSSVVLCFRCHFRSLYFFFISLTFLGTVCFNVLILYSSIITSTNHVLSVCHLELTTTDLF